ncbi:MAG: SH3 domain-containing protein [Planctomycetota bacterium]
MSVLRHPWSLSWGLALALAVGASSTAFAQPAPVGSASTAAVETANAPLGDYALRGQSFSDTAPLTSGAPFRGYGRLRMTPAGLELIRTVAGGAPEAAPALRGVADRWAFAQAGPAGQPGVRAWGRVTASSLNLRSGPGTGFEARGAAPRGAALLLLGGQQGVWREVLDRDGQRLWTHSGYLRVERQQTGGEREVEVVADPRGPWAVSFAGARPLASERMEKKSNALVFVGMGVGASHEVWDLRRVQGVEVHAVLDGKEGEEGIATLLGQRRDLSQDADVEGFLDDLGLRDEQREQTRRAITNLGTDARDEAAQLALVFWEAEQGERVLERLILSGHCVGTSVWGDENGSLRFDSVALLAQAFPGAAGQLEDLMIAGCYSQSLRQVDKFRGMFPNLASFWAYGASAPGSWTGATIHNAFWEEATRGSEPGLVSRTLARGTRKGDNVATWNVVTGYEGDGPLRPREVVEAELAALQPTCDEFDSGARQVQDTQYGPLRDYYSRVQELLGNPASPAAEHPRLEAARDHTIRLIFYEATIRGRFQAVYAADVQAGYAALGLTAPDFATLSRAEALAAIADLEAALGAASPAPPAAARAVELLQHGLRDLDPFVIPNEWV